MAYGVVNLDSYDIMNIAAFRSAKAAFNVENGSVLQLTAKSTDNFEGDVWTANTPGSGEGLKNLWIVDEPVNGRIVDASGNVYDSVDNNPKNFVNLAGTVFNTHQLKVGELVTLSADAIGGTKGVNTFVVATNGKLKLQWSAAAVTGVSLKLIKQNDFAIADNTWKQRTTAYQFEVVAVA